MATNTVNQSDASSGSTHAARVEYRRACASYATQSADIQAELAQEMAGEVLAHYDRARSLLAALVSELQADPADKTALHLAQVAEAWLNDEAHVAQESRLKACLDVMANVQEPALAS